MAYAVIVSPLARRDLQGIVRYIALDQPMRALAFGELLLAKCQVLADHPQLGRKVPEFDLDELRELVVRGYRVVYRHNASAQRVEILRFWHGARGVPVLP